MRRWTVVLVAVAILSLAVASAFSPTAAASPSPRTPAAPVAANATAPTLAASAAPTAVELGSNVTLTITVSNYNYTACGSGALNWQLTNGASFLNPNTAEITGAGTFSYVWASEAPTGTWKFEGALSTECTLAISNSVSINVFSPPSGGIALPSFVYQFLKDTYNAVKTALIQGIAIPASAVIGAIAAGFATLEQPWGNALESLGVLGPVALVAVLLSMAMAVYAILDMTGAAKVILGY